MERTHHLSAALGITGLVTHSRVKKQCSSSRGRGTGGRRLEVVEEAGKEKRRHPGPADELSTPAKVAEKTSAASKCNVRGWMEISTLYGSFIIISGSAIQFA